MSLRIGEEYFSSTREDGTDYSAIEEGYISVTPMRSDMTNHSALVELGAWNAIPAAEPGGGGRGEPADLDREVQRR